jgi:hypothetical protein
MLTSMGAGAGAANTSITMTPSGGAGEMMEYWVVTACGWSNVATQATVRTATARGKGRGHSPVKISTLL